MINILALFQCLQPLLAGTTLKQFSLIAFAMLVMTGRVTMLSMSRWAGKGGSYRTVQRFFSTKAVPWAALFWVFFQRHLHRSDHRYLLAGDEVVVTKAGKETSGLDRFYSSLYGKPVPGLSFFALSLVDLSERRSFPIRVEQVLRTEAEKVASKAKAEAKRQKPAAERRPRGRPKGSQNKSKAEVELTPELLRIKGMVAAQLELMTALLPLTYLALDGHFGNSHALFMVRQCGLHLISKLRCDSALYFPYEGPYSGHGPPRKYGDKLDYRCIPGKYLKETRVEKDIQTRIYQAELLHKEFSQPLNVVIIVKTNLQTGAWAHVILFSSHLELPYDQLIDYYGLRFQIEFNFRDAKQHWGLEDFMNTTPSAVTNAANLSLFMVNLSYRLLCDFRQTDPEASILDLKAYCRGYKYVDETIKMLPQKPEPILLVQILNKVACLGRIHTAQPVLSPS
jgi:putative transposase